MNFDHQLSQLSSEFFSSPIVNFLNKNNIPKYDDPELNSFTHEMLGLLAVIPYKIYAIKDYKLFITSDDNNNLVVNYNCDKKHPDFPFMRAYLDKINDEFFAISSSGLIENSVWNDESSSLSLSDPQDLYRLVVELYNELEIFNPTMADVILSSVASIYERYFPEEHDVEKLSQPDKQLSIVRALKSIVSCFDNTDDFTVKPSEHKNKFYFEITLGRDTPVSFSQRFNTLHSIYFEIEAREALCKNQTVEMWPCGTGFSIGFDDPKNSLELIFNLYRDLDIYDKCKDKKAKIFISPSELKANLEEEPQRRKPIEYKH